MVYGFSFSKGQCDWLNLDWKKLLDKLSNSNLKIIRLGLYWNEIEKENGIYDFSSSKEIIEYSQNLGFEIILTVGMKAPRWPEFYIPNFVQKSELEQKTLDFIKACVEQFKDFENISTWQIENEPLDPSGPSNLNIDSDFLQQEIDLVKGLDSSRKILVTIWGNDLKKRNNLEKILKLKNIDQIGFDFYPKQPGLFRYRGPDYSLVDLKEITIHLQSKNIKPIIAELQAEPWEKFDYKKSPEKVKSVSLDLIKKNIIDYKDLGFEEIILWGIEYCEWAGILDELTDFIL